MKDESIDKKFKEIFYPSKYLLISRLDVGGKAFDLIKFLFDVRNLSDYQSNNIDISSMDSEEIELLA